MKSSRYDLPGGILAIDREHSGAAIRRHAEHRAAGRAHQHAGDMRAVLGLDRGRGRRDELAAQGDTRLPERGMIEIDGAVDDRDLHLGVATRR